MNVDLLISEILARPPLWDRKDRNHHNRFVLDRLWNEVAVILKTKPTVVRGKWKTLRDKFRTILASIPKSKSGDVQLTDYRGEWKYFRSLNFIKDQFTVRKSSESFIENNADEALLDESQNDKNLSEDDSDNDYDRHNYMSVQEGHSTGSPQDISSSTRPSSNAGKKSEAKRLNKDALGDALLQVEKEKLLFLQEKRAKTEEDDEDLNFFKSLLPHVRHFSAYDKMEYRMRVMKITQDYLKPSTHSVTPVSGNSPGCFTSIGDINETIMVKAESHLNLSESEPNSYQNFSDTV